MNMTRGKTSDALELMSQEIFMEKLDTTWIPFLVSLSRVSSVGACQGYSGLGSGCPWFRFITDFVRGAPPRDN